jgi:hypothetical protein
MILESFLVLGVIGIILLFFYKQAVQEFRILQIDSFEKAMGLLYERCPIVVLPAPQPSQLWTRAELQQRPAFQKLLVGKQSLAAALQKESVILKHEEAEALATKDGLPIWVQKTILPYFTNSSWWAPCLRPRTEVMIGAQGLRQTYAYSTVVLATEGILTVSLLNESSNAYLPVDWLGKRVSQLTRDEAPLLHQIQYIDVVVRPGSALIIPPHWKVCWETKRETKRETKQQTQKDDKNTSKSALAVWIEFHHPLSRFVRYVANREMGKK